MALGRHRHNYGIVTIEGEPAASSEAQLLKIQIALDPPQRVIVEPTPPPELVQRGSLGLDQLSLQEREGGAQLSRGLRGGGIRRRSGKGGSEPAAELHPGNGPRPAGATPSAP